MKKELRERLEELGCRILVSSRNEIYVSMRFFETALHRFSYELSLSTQTIGTDGRKLYFNPKCLMEMYDKSPATVNRAYLHVLLHCLFRHLFKSESKGKSRNKNKSKGKIGTEERERREEWDLACDIAVESIMDSFEGITCVLSNPSDYRKEVYDKLSSRLPVLSAEGIYRELRTAAVSQEEYDRLKKEFTVDDHGFWQQEENRQENQPPEKQQDQEQLAKEWEETAKKTQTAMETFYRQIGDKAGSLKRMLKIKNRRTDDLETFLKQFAVIKEEIKTDPDSFDYIPYCFGMNGYGLGEEKIPLIEPLEYKEKHGIDDFAIAIDTSGSVSGTQIEAFLSETVPILRSSETFFRKMNIHVIQCDAKIQKDTIIKSKKDVKQLLETVEISGFGGTDFRPVFSYLEELSKNGTFTNLRGLLYFTDGFGTYPEKIPSFQTAFLLPAQQEAEPKVPVWAMKLYVDTTSD